MPSTTLCEQRDHRNILLEDFGHGLAIQANQHLIVHAGKAMILDPGGHKVYNRVLTETTSLLRGAKLEYIFLSHQDPDIVAATNGWLMTTDADAWCSALWTRFVPHFGLDRLVEARLKAIPDAGMYLDLGGLDLMSLPAHFLHSCGNFHVYDPVAKILYSGDLAASFGTGQLQATDFDAHVPYLEPFHRRYMGSRRALQAWVRMVRGLDIETIAPQHGAMLRGREIVQRFLDWCDTLECGIDALEDLYQVPPRP